MVKTDDDGFTDLLSGSFLAAVFVWVWMSVLSLIKSMDLTTQIILYLLQYIFFGLGSFTASYVVSRKKGYVERGLGLKIGIGGWIISSTLFIPRSEKVNFITIFLMLIVFLMGSRLGISFYKKTRISLPKDS